MNAFAGKKVLLVEDDKNISFGMQLALEAAGHSVTVAESLQEAINEMKKSTFDILLSDTNIKGEKYNTDGIEVAKEFRKVNPKGKIIGMSNNVEDNRPLWEGVSDEFFDKAVVVRMFTAGKIESILGN